MRRALIVLAFGTTAVWACGAARSGGFPTPDGGLTGSEESGGGFAGDGSDYGGGGGLTADPTTCAEAASSRSYIGCDYWPTVTANTVWSVFDFTAIVANGGADTATITVTGPSNTNITTTVGPGQLTKIYLPWVPALKGQDSDNCGVSRVMTSSVLAPASAFHLVSSVPVTVYQFNALEYVGQGGPAGKSWAACPGNTACSDSTSPNLGHASGCYSFTNDASLLLPSTAMTGTYRVTGHGGLNSVEGATMTITATADNTTVHVKVSSTGSVAGGTGIIPTAAGSTLTLTLNAGDVAELLGDLTDQSDLSGSLVQANQPVQVITGMPCATMPDNAFACDHVEESNLPAETFGRDYVVAQPPGPNGNVVAHEVRIYGNFDGTTLTYSPSAPPGCPTTINAGEVVDCGTGLGSVCENPQTGVYDYPCGNGKMVGMDFEVTGNNPFAVATFTQGASLVDPTTKGPKQQGDPDQSIVVAVKQYRTNYVFLAPTDYQENYAVITAPTGASISLDGAHVTTAPTPVGSNGYGVIRIPLAAGNAGAHVLTASAPVGLEITGYGASTSYTYPGGLDLQHIAPPPVQ
jgi:hypothetical protein